MLLVNIYTIRINFLSLIRRYFQRVACCDTSRHGSQLPRDRAAGHLGQCLRHGKNLEPSPILYICILYYSVVGKFHKSNRPEFDHREEFQDRNHAGDPRGPEEHEGVQYQRELRDHDALQARWGREGSAVPRHQEVPCYDSQGGGGRLWQG